MKNLLNKNFTAKGSAFSKIRLTFLDEYDFGQNSKARFKTYFQMPFNFLDDSRLKMVGPALSFPLILMIKKYVLSPIEYRMKQDQGTIVVSRSDFQLPNRVSIDCLLSALRDAQLIEIIDDTVLVNKIKEDSIIECKILPEAAPKKPDPVGGEIQVEAERPRGIKKLKGRADALPDLAEVWNLHRGQLAAVRGCAGKRLSSAKSRWSENPDPVLWQKIVEKIAASDFCKGGGRDGWRADFDFLVAPSTMDKVLEGKYDNRKQTTDLKSSSNFSSGTCSVDLT